MSDEVLAQLEEILPNRYQVRQAEDRAAIAELAASIERVGMLQTPTARRVKNGYELAFGHSRKAAYQLLVEQDKQQFSAMPLIVRELTDLEMFELVVTENLKRKDLSPVEEAKAMQRYMDEFGKTSQETGEFFGVAAETVRSKVRLLNLPQSVQGMIQVGDISESAARKILAAHRIDPKAAEKAAAEIGKLEQPDAHDIDAELQRAIGYRKDVVRMDDELWPMGWQHNGTVRPLDAAELTDALALKQKDYAKHQDQIGALASSLAAGMEVEPAAFAEFPAETVTRFQHISNPPACGGCTFHARLEGTDYCGLKLCYDRKVQAWLRQDLQRLSKEMGIAVHVPEVDPKPTGVYDSDWGPDAQSFAGLVTRKSDKLRLIIRTDQHYGKYPRTESRHIAIVSIAPRPKKKDVTPEGRAESAEEHARAVKRREKLEREGRRAELAETFLVEVAVPIFAQAFGGLTSIDVMIQLSEFHSHDEGWKQFQAASKPKQKKLLHQRLAARLLLDEDRTYDVMPSQWDPKSPLRKGPSGVAEYLRDKVAPKWGVKVPKNFIETAKEWEANAEKGAAES